MERLDRYFHKLAAASFARYGFAYGDLLSHWAEIAGEDVASLCQPERIKWPRGGKDDLRKLGGILVLLTEPGRGLDVQYRSSIIITRVNQFYGYGAITAITLKQSPFPLKKTKDFRFLQNNPDILRETEASLPDMAEADLRQALARLGAGVKQRLKLSPQGK